MVFYVCARSVAVLAAWSPARHSRRRLPPYAPWRIDDTLIDWDGDQTPSGPPPEEAQGGDYFLRVIDFSIIVGRVLRDIYSLDKRDWRVMS